MKRMFLISMVVFICVFAEGALVKAEDLDSSNHSRELVLEEAFLRAIGDEIAKSITTYYGQPKRYFLERINNIKKIKMKIHLT